MRKDYAVREEEIGLMRVSYHCSEVVGSAFKVWGDGFAFESLNIESRTFLGML